MGLFAYSFSIWRTFSPLITASFQFFQRSFCANFCFTAESKPQEKKLSKKEQKAKEDAEFEALMNQVGVSEVKQEDVKKPEEAATAQPGDANAKNKKKKEKRKAKQA